MRTQSPRSASHRDARFDDEDIVAEIADATAQNDAGAWIGWAAWLLALAWLGAAGLAGVAALGADGLAGLSPIILAAAGAGAILPAFLILFAGAAAREGARARLMATRLAEAADRMLHPNPGAEAAARRLGVSVRGEIAALDRALDQALHKVREVESVIARQTLAVDHAAGAAQAGARQMITGLERERADLMALADDLNSQAGMIGEAISRHTRLIADAARLAEAEVRAADEALDSRLSSFGAAAALISDRTAALTSAAQTSAESALRLENALSQALDSLTKASSLTDAARQSADQATLAANSTAGAVRETTARAVEEAKRAAEFIRGEAAALEREGAAALERLRAGLHLGRGPVETAPRAEERRVEAGRSGGSRPGDAGYAESLSQPAAAQQPTPKPALKPMAGGSDTAAEPTPAPAQPPAPKPHDGPPAPTRWTWREVLAAIDEERPVQPNPVRARSAPVTTPPQSPTPSAAQAPAAKPVAPAAERLTTSPMSVHFERPASGRAQPSKPVESPVERAGAGLRPVEDAPAASGAAAAASMVPLGGSTLPIVAVIEAVDLRLHEVFSANALDRIAAKARNGTQSRRRAVREAAPDAVLRLAERLDHDNDARAEAAAFLRADGARVSELLGRGRASMGAEATRAFLLIDAAYA